MYSKLIPAVNLIREALQFGEITHFEDRMTGDTTGMALQIIGKLMQLNTPYEISVEGLTCNTYMDEYLLQTIREKLDILGLKHFVLDKKNLTVKYDISYDL